MNEFTLKDGTCFLALSYAMDESKVLGIEYKSQDYYDYIAVRKIEIWEALKTHSYSFSDFVKQVSV